MLNLAGVEYQNTWKATGIVNAADYTLTLKPLDEGSRDKLPGGLYWTPENVYLKILKILITKEIF
ncbi:MAG: hypothetical protein ACI9O4_000047 [Chitinophagales bacterium]